MLASSHIPTIHSAASCMMLSVTVSLPHAVSFRYHRRVLGLDHRKILVQLATSSRDLISNYCSITERSHEGKNSHEDHQLCRHIKIRWRQVHMKCGDSRCRKLSGISLCRTTPAHTAHAPVKSRNAAATMQTHTRHIPYGPTSNFGGC